MKTLVCKKPGLFEYEERPSPSLTKGNSIIRIKRVGICGTDLHAFEGTQPFFQYPRVLGHELAAQVEEVGSAKDFKPGELVTIIPYIHCGKCIACRNGKTNCCTSMNVCGVHSDGGMTEYFSVPSDLLLHGDGLSFDQLALIEPLAIGAHGVRRAGISPGEFVLVIGAGPIGLGTIQYASLAGAHVIVMDVNANRLKFCKESLGVRHIINSSTDRVMVDLKAITNGDMPTVVIDATGNLRAINEGFNYLAHGGRYVLIGLQKGDISFSHPEFHKREATLMSSRNATTQDFVYVINSIRSGSIDPLKLITHRVKFGEIATEFEKWLRPEEGVIKAMVELD
jgi:2-desacetyl-2-hydroxyethyl bacteriochlorophyllide A dehydrogenase